MRRSSGEGGSERVRGSCGRPDAAETAMRGWGMTTATLVPAPVTAIRPRAIAAAASSPTEALGEQIAALAARLHAATYDLLVLLREFDHRTRLEQRLPVLRPLAALAHRHRPRRGAREGARRPRAGGAAAHQRHHAARRDLLRQGASPDPRRPPRTTKRRCWTSPRPEPPRKRNAWSAPGGEWTTWPPRRRKSRGTCTASCRPGWTMTAWS